MNLYRKLRPKKFSEIKEQNLIKEVLLNQVKNNKINHGYLFSGSHGTGKTSCAKIFARAINCLNPENGEPCNKCKNCLEILEDRSVDVIELDAASNNGVDNIRELKNLGAYPPSTLKKKVYIIDEAHMLSQSACNALLKILEEPPDHLVFILATTDPEKLLDTVRSRLQRFNFHRIGDKTIKNTIKEVLKEQNEFLVDEIIDVIVMESHGALRDAFSILEQVLNIPHRPVLLEDVEDLLGSLSDYKVINLAISLVNRDAKKIHIELTKLLDEGRREDIILLTLIKVFKDIHLEILGIDTNSYVKEYIKDLLDVKHTRYILDIIEKLTETLNSIKDASNPNLLLEAHLLTFTRGKEVLKPLSLSEEKEILPIINRYVEDERKTDREEEALEEKDRDKEKEIDNLKNEEEIIEKIESNDNKKIESNDNKKIESNDNKEEIINDKVEENIVDEIKKEYEEPICDTDKSNLELFLEKINIHFPIVVSSLSNYDISLEEANVIFYKKDPSHIDNLMDVYKDDLNKMYKTINSKGSILFRNVDPNIEKAREIFRDKLNILN